MKTFVTGGTGFIGSRLVQLLVAQGAEVTVLTRNSASKFPATVKIVQGDILKPATIKDIDGDFDIVFHLAAFISFNVSMSKELDLVNVQGTRNILKISRQWKNTRTVLVSSACTMGVSPDTRLLDETARPSDEMISRNPYMASKIRMEDMAFSMSQEQDIVVVNPTTVYGPGDWSMNSGTLIKKVCTSRILPVPPGGSNVVDIDDVVAGILTAGQKGSSGKRYILGGENLPFTEIFSVIADVVGKAPLRLNIPRWTCMPLSALAGTAGRLSGSRFITKQMIEDLYRFKYYSNKLALNELDWQPKHNFRDSVSRAMSFYIDKGLICA
jgi:dihydroflavonol-4-reductase